LEKKEGGTEGGKKQGEQSNGNTKRGRKLAEAQLGNVGHTQKRLMVTTAEEGVRYKPVCDKGRKRKNPPTASKKPGAGTKERKRRRGKLGASVGSTICWSGKICPAS